MKSLLAFSKSESGAVTVDWVVLCAAAIGLAVLISGVLGDGTMVAVNALATYLENWSFG